MRTRTPAVLAAAAVAVLVAGCARGTDKPPVVRADPPPCAKNIVVIPDRGPGLVCLSVGGTLRVELGKGGSATEQGPALHEISAGVYRGAAKGTAELSVVRRLCPAPKPGEAACMAVGGRKVTVDVR